MTKGELAKQYFTSGCNCAQAVVMAFSDEIDIDKDTLLRMASSFGGGFGRMGEVCGAFSGVAMVLGYLRGYSDLEDFSLKKAHYATIQELGAQFKEEFGSIVCRELLQGVNITPKNEPSPRTDGYYKKRPCGEIVEFAANMLEAKLNR